MKSLYLLVVLSAMAAIVFKLNSTMTLFFVFKPLTTLLIIAALVQFGCRDNKPLYGAILAGLCACLLGDVFLLDDAYFVFGLASFLIGHLLFALAFMSLGGFKSYWWLLVVLGGIGVVLYAYLLPELGALWWPVLIYITVIVLMAWQGVNLFLWRKSATTVCIAVAVILFMISDSFIAINKFTHPFEASILVVLSTYWLSIGLLSYSVVVFNAESKSVT